MLESCVAVFFRNETCALIGARALERLAGDGSLEIRAAAIVRRDETAGLYVSKAPKVAGTRTAFTLALGFIEGMQSVSLAATESSLTAGDVERLLAPGRAALIANVVEGSRDAFEASMRELGGAVYRRPNDASRYAIFEIEDDSSERSVRS